VKHEVRIQVGSDEGGWYTVPGVQEYAIASDITTPSDAFALRFPFERALYLSCRPDNEVRIFIDERRVFTGVIDARHRSSSRSGGGFIQISGRDLMGRVVDESAPLISFGGLGIADLARKLIEGSAIKTVTLSNATNRRLVAGAAPRATKEPPILTGPKPPKKVEPGESIWQVLARFLADAGLLAFCGAAGDLVICTPNYNQQPGHVLIHAPRGSARTLQANVVALEDKQDIGEMYSLIVALVQPPDTKEDETPPRRGMARDDPRRPDGTGARFRLRKRLIIQDDAARDANQRAERELKERAGHIDSRIVTADGHGYINAQGERVLFAADTPIRLEDDEIGSNGDWYIAGVTHTADKKQAGQRSTLTLVPIGVDLRPQGA
jgi:prophage tail gpP-like protein